jgi:beta-glucosidase
MTLDEKIQLVHGGASSTWYNQTQPRGAAGWVPGIQRLGIPTLYLSDGSVGVGNSVEVVERRFDAP